MKKADGHKNEKFLDIKKAEMEQDAGVWGGGEVSNNKNSPTLSYLRQ